MVIGLGYFETYWDMVSRFLGTPLSQAATTKAASHIHLAPLVPNKSRCMKRRGSSASVRLENP